MTACCSTTAPTADQSDATGPRASSTNPRRRRACQPHNARSSPLLRVVAHPQRSLSEGRADAARGTPPRPKRSNICHLWPDDEDSTRHSVQREFLATARPGSGHAVSIRSATDVRWTSMMLTAAVAARRSRLEDRHQSLARCRSEDPPYRPEPPHWRPDLAVLAGPGRGVAGRQPMCE